MRALRSRLRSARLLLPCLLLGACALDPSLMSTGEEQRQGEQAARQVAEQIGLHTSPVLDPYVAQLGARIAARSPRQDVTYRFAIADMPETNAFALPGGWIYVSRGLLAMSNGEAELANVLAHEVAHVSARHHARRQARASGVGLLSALGTIAAAVLAGPEAAQAISSVGQVAGAGFIASYGREHEREADEIGQSIAASAGWSPEGMARFLETLDREDRVRSGQPRAGSFLDSHPLTPERVQAARARARGMRTTAAAPIAGSRDAFVERLRGLPLGPDPSQGRFEGQDFLHADMDLHLTFPEGWALQNTPAAVLSVSAARDAMLQLGFDGPGSDPSVVARRFIEGSGAQVLRSGPRHVNGRAAYNLVAGAPDGSVADITWITHGGGIYRVSGISSSAKIEQYRPLFERTLQSLRALTRAERAGFRRRELGLVAARAGETLEQLSRRSGNAWSVERTEVANQLPAGGGALPRGFRVKVALERPYP